MMGNGIGYRSYDKAMANKYGKIRKIAFLTLVPLAHRLLPMHRGSFPAALFCAKLPIESGDLGSQKGSRLDPTPTTPFSFINLLIGMAFWTSPTGDSGTKLKILTTNFPPRKEMFGNFNRPASKKKENWEHGNTPVAPTP